MPVDTKKVLWVVFAVGLFLIVVFGITLALFYPKQGGANAPASLANVIPAPAPGTDPEVLVRNPMPTISQEPPPAPAGNLTIIYGEKPDPASIPSSIDPVNPPAPSSGNLKPGASTMNAKPAEVVPAVSKPAVKTVAKPASAAPAKPKKVLVDEFWIQAASFTSHTRANDLKAALATKGLSSLISIKDVDGVSYYRVRIGPYAAQKEADGWLGRIKGMIGCEEAYISKTRVERTL